MPIYGIEQRCLLPLLQEVISPALIGSILDVYLVVAEVSLRPLVTNNTSEAIERAVERSINDAVIVQPMIGTHFQNCDDREALTVPLGSTAQNPGFQSNTKETEVL